MYIIVMGAGISLDGVMPPHIFARLDKAIQLYRANQNSKIILSGGYSFLHGEKKPVITEAEAMKQYLLENNISESDILLENSSRDTISNAYFLKKNIFIPHNIKQAVVTVVQYNIDRVRYIFKKVFGKEYKFSYILVDEKIDKNLMDKLIERQRELVLKTQKFLSNMEDGDHEFLADKFYGAGYYREDRPEWARRFVRGSD